MTSKQKTNNVVSIILAVTAAILFCVIGIAITSFLMLENIIGENRVEIILPLLLFLTTIVGNTFIGTGKQKSLINNIIVTLIITSVIITGSIMFHGTHENYGNKIAAILLGGCTSCIICLKSNQHRKKKKVFSCENTQKRRMG